jgi:2-methylcitrate dehydratase PrpD
VVYPTIGIDTFAVEQIRNPEVQALMPRITLRANAAFDTAAPLSQARVTVRLRDGREWSQRADGARGYPGRLTDNELSSKFTDCAVRMVGPSAARHAWDSLSAWLADAGVGDIRAITAILASR